MASRASDRRILGLALPALGALAAEPLYVLVDTAVVGHLGAEQLAGVAIGGALLTNVAWLCNFLAYGSTARARGCSARAGATMRWPSACRPRGWRCCIGVVLALAFQLVAEPALRPHRRRRRPGRARTPPSSGCASRRSAHRSSCSRSPARAGCAACRRCAGRSLFLLGANAASAAASPFLVYGLDIGVAGSAVANVLAQTIAAGALPARAAADRRAAAAVTGRRCGRSSWSAAT